ncbi:hypothetical protein K458DRAFT_101052 [Lentithecium fluviatile CBS 122367]|uniref:Uncharacterized protein n=1 Tax=Lentithecium fluviatile CBS 122367 TaxID=1168545 RepID=A0A6G1JIK5_9PLEO|nr:hypothetical protein K458DRAFT_101052 [Lentithecium fluviatile CBS 122367]
MTKPPKLHREIAQPLRVAYEFVARLTGRNQDSQRSRPRSSTKPNMPDQNIVVEELAPGALQELQDRADLIRNGTYQASGTEGYALRSENEQLVERFPKPEKSETRITAIRVDKLAKLPVKKGATVILIPLNTDDGTIPKIHNEALAFGKYAEVTAAAPMELAIEGSFHSLLLLRQAVND